MPKKGITGHDEWVVTPRPHMDDLGKLLAARCPPGSVNLHLAQAKCRLFPDRDPESVYREYGLEAGRD